MSCYILNTDITRSVYWLYCVSNTAAVFLLLDLPGFYSTELSVVPTWNAIKYVEGYNLSQIESYSAVCLSVGRSQLVIINQ